MVGGVSWSRGADGSRTIRVLLHVALGVPLGLAVLLIGRAMAPTVTDPNGPVIVAGVLLVLGVAVVGTRRGRLSLGESTVADRVPTETEAAIPGVRPVGVLVAAAFGGVGLGVAARAGVEWLLAAALVGHLVPAVAVGLLRTNGRIDPEDGVLQYGDDEIPLRALSSLRSWAVGDTAFLWCTFVRGGGRTPGLVVLPAAVFRDHRETFEEGIAANDGAIEDPDRPLRLVAYGFGGGMLCLGLFSTGVLYAGGASVVVGAFVGGSLALLGAFFVVLGRYET